jgi:DNA-binding SARP family transcriptional activator
MSFILRILGPVEVVQDGHRRSLGPPKRRTMAVALALEANRSVSLARLAEAVWPVAPPPSAVANLRSHAAELRQVMGDRLVARPGAYQLDLGPGELDAEEFLRLSREGREALSAGQPAVALTRLGAALGCWRGAAGDGLETGGAVESRLRALDEQRLDALEDHIAARHATGLFADSLTQLRSHVADHPLRERAWGLLMVALYRSGNVAGALSAYADARAFLGEQLGIEPGPDLIALHRTILLRDAAPPPGRDVHARSARFRTNRGPSYAWRSSS